MIQIDDFLISEDIFTESFVCNLSKCKGVCCVDGDAGAPLSKEETQILDEIYPKIKHYIRPEAQKVIEENGTYYTDEDGDLVTPLVNNAECAYVIFEENGTTKCGIEKAFEDGVIDFHKPISCHLYPIRVTQYKSFAAINYHEWDICSDACSLGSELKVKVYQFLKKPLIRAYGEKWYQTLCEAANEWYSEFGQTKLK